jgi:protein-tyrosine-phosphatase
MAHAIFAHELRRRGLHVSVTSASVVDMEEMQVAFHSRAACEHYGTPLQRAFSAFHASVDLKSAVRVFGMQRSHLDALQRNASVAPERLSLLGEFDPLRRGSEIDDPMGGTLEQHLACYRVLRDCILTYLDATDELGGVSRSR